MKCKKCGTAMQELGRERVMAELDDDETEGQWADHMAAELSGDFGEWGATEIDYKCPNCGNSVTVIED